MLVEILFLALVFLVALLIALDVSKAPTESTHVQAERRPYETEREITGAPGAAGARVLPREPAGTGITASAHDSGPRRLDGISASAGGHRRTGTRPAAQRKGPRGGLKDWSVGSRLFLLAIIAAVAATVVTLSVVRMADSLRSVSMHSQISSVRDGAIMSAIVAGVILIVVLALALWLANHRGQVCATTVAPTPGGGSRGGRGSAA